MWIPGWRSRAYQGSLRIGGGLGAPHSLVLAYLHADHCNGLVYAATTSTPSPTSRCSMSAPTSASWRANRAGATRPSTAWAEIGSTSTSSPPFRRRAKWRECPEGNLGGGQRPGPLPRIRPSQGRTPRPRGHRLPLLPLTPRGMTTRVWPPSRLPIWRSSMIQRRGG